MNIRNIKTIAFQGIEGANSHLACNKLFPKAKTISCETFEQVFDRQNCILLSFWLLFSQRSRKLFKKMCPGTPGKQKEHTRYDF